MQGTLYASGSFVSPLIPSFDILDNGIDFDSLSDTEPTAAELAAIEAGGIEAEPAVTEVPASLESFSLLDAVRAVAILQAQGRADLLATIDDSGALADADVNPVYASLMMLRHYADKEEKKGANHFADNANHEGRDAGGRFASKHDSAAHKAVKLTEAVRLYYTGQLPLIQAAKHAGIRVATFKRLVIQRHGVEAVRRQGRIAKCA